MSIRRVGRTREQQSVDDDNGSLFIRVNDDQQHPLGWVFANVTASERVVRHDATRAAILGCVARYCTDLRPWRLWNPAPGKAFTT
jgi:uncharacterized protein YbdZ (MbtH family)